MLTPTKSKAFAFEIDFKDSEQAHKNNASPSMKVKERLEQRKQEALTSSAEKTTHLTFEEKLEKAKEKRM